MASKLKKAIGAVKDQTSISLAKVSSSGNALEVAVLKATSHDPSVPLDGKHAREILRLVSSSKAHAAACARAIGKRIGRTRNWVVALKSLVLILRLFQDGDPYFPREVLHAMKRGARILNLSSFRDSSSSSSPWDFTSFVRTFALYLDERLDCFLTGKLQRRYTHQYHHQGPAAYQRSKSRGPNEPVRDMKPAMLLDRMSHWQRLLDRAIATRPTGAARADPLVVVALHAVVQESFDLYRDISDGLSLVLDSFFHLQYQNCVAAFQTCVKAVKQFEELTAFYSLCKSLSVGRSSEYPSIQVISDELIETLQEFLKDQSSFPSGPVGPPSVLRVGLERVSSPVASSDRGLTQRLSLEELISATETTGAVGPAISIDLEAYPSASIGDHQGNDDDAFGPSEPGSSRSLPVTSSIVDLMSLDDWADDNDRGDEDTVDDQLQDRGEEHKEEETLDSSLASMNWEIVLAETISTPPASNNADTFPTFSEQPMAAPAAGIGWDLVLFEAPPVQEPMANNHYNPFLVDSFELTQASSSDQPAVAVVPTFQAAPTFSAQRMGRDPFESQNGDDPFGEFTGEMMYGDPMEQQNLLQEQQMWLQNQNKIIAKNWI